MIFFCDFFVEMIRYQTISHSSVSRSNKRHYVQFACWILLVVFFVCIFLTNLIDFRRLDVWSDKVVSSVDVVDINTSFMESFRNASSESAVQMWSPCVYNIRNDRYPMLYPRHYLVSHLCIISVHVLLSRSLCTYSETNYV